MTDIKRFDALLGKASAAVAGERHPALLEALRLVRGELLADEPYADFAVPLRRVYAERCLQATVDLAGDLVVAERYDEAIDFAEHALTLDALHERAYRVLILAYYSRGEQAAAFRAYDRCRRALMEAIGASPLAETEALYVDVLNHAPLGAASAAVIDARPSAPRRRLSNLSPGMHRTATSTSHIKRSSRGAPDVVFLPGSFTHVEVGWEEPRYADFLSRLANGRRLLLFDKRGMGMSDAGRRDDPVESRADDVGAVMDAAGSERAVLFGISEGAPLAMTYAVEHPERVRALVLYAAFARLGNTDDYEIGWSAEFTELFKGGIDTFWKTGRGGEIAQPTVAGDVRYAEWMSRYFRLAASPATAKAMIDYFVSIDVRDLLTRVEVPTLTILRRDDKWVPADVSRYVADRVPAARCVEVAGEDHWPWIGDADSVLEPALAFIDELTR